MKLTEEEKRIAAETTRQILFQCNDSRGNLIPVLQRVQDKLGYVPPVAMEEVAAHFQVPPVDVYGVITFYNQFRLTPPGKRQVKICMGTACHMRGAHIIQDSWERRLNIKVGETTEDREYSLERVACVGCCTMAPVVVINEEVHGKITPTRVDGLIFSHQLDKKKEQQNTKEGDATSE
ncbi:NADH-quinone oxidoreductase subunit NuoE [Desulfoscipio geothermicus]|uniref:NADH-quinone oxidoreductase subunit E n=1 Tax=Desulfoscipio geothermicus DSM 3669 TaxID=1121426 RepID=A0A1I6CP09_9FIRM|nr:NADH-quinone oxidoreductase subunit NuoE [Desulfoscipio geothermicus]SFQ94915.1 NADH-quinone oxidoreductase subunit E [Desulfoscipio geothermicus DSM 3669]